MRRARLQEAVVHLNPRPGELIPTLLVLAIASCLTLPFIGIKPFYSRGEGREAIVADSILREGKWVLPSGYGSSVPSKPPFTHWLMALSSLPGRGVTEFTARLPSALSAVLFATFFYLFLRRRVAGKEALLTTLLLLLSLEWSRAAVTCRVDMVLSAFLAGVFLLIFRWEERELRGIPFVAILLLSGAVLAKGPVALILSLGVLGVHLLLLDRGVAAIFRATFILSVPALLLAALWYLAAYQAGGERFFAMVWSENVSRFTSSMDDSPHEHTVFYLFGTLILGLLPWSLFFLEELIRAVRSASCVSRKAIRSIIGSVSSAESCRKYKIMDRLVRFSWIVVLIVFLFYCIPSSKRSVYLLPLYPCGCFLIARYLLTLAQKRPQQILRMARGYTTVLLSVLLIFFMLISGLISTDWIQLFGSSENFRWYVTAISEMPHSLTWVFGAFAAGLFVIWVSLFRNRDGTEAGVRCVYGVVLSQLLLLIMVHGLIAPYVAWKLSPKQFASELLSALQPDARVFSFEDRLFDLDFYLEHRLFEMRCNDPLSQGDFVIVKTEDAPRFMGCIEGRYVPSVVRQSAHGIDKPGRFIQLYGILAKL